MSYDSVVAADSPYAWWALDDASGSSTAADSSGNGHTGTVNGGVTFGVGTLPAGMTGTCASFDGTSGYIDTGIQNTWTAWSAEVWLNLDGVTAAANGRFINSGWFGSGAGYDLYYNNGTVAVQLNPATGDPNVTSTFSLPASGWTHVVATWDGTTLILYVNGSSVGTYAYSAASFSDNNVGEISGYGGGGSSYYAGLMTQVALYDTALSATQVLNHYDTGTTAPATSESGPFAVSLPTPGASLSAASGTKTVSGPFALVLPPGTDRGTESGALSLQLPAPSAALAGVPARTVSGALGILLPSAACAVSGVITHNGVLAISFGVPLPALTRFEMFGAQSLASGSVQLPLPRTDIAALVPLPGYSMHYRGRWISARLPRKEDQ